MTDIAPIIVLCDACGSEGRIYVRTGAYDDQGPIDRDDGRCDVCDGTGREMIEDVEPITEADLWRDTDRATQTGCLRGGGHGRT